VGLSDLLVDLSSTIGGSSVASSYYSSTDTTSLESGFEIAGVSTADGGLAFLVLFYYFFSAALTAETTAAAIDNELPLTWSCARTSRRHQHPGLPGVATDLNIGIFVSLHRRVRFIKLQQPSCWRLILVRPNFHRCFSPSRRGAGHQN
jgi:hypothetical protein